MPTDKAGTEIDVGCRVTEADLNFGDGTVESVSVPLASGDGFNIGVHWDNPALGGPAWSAEGGGRGAEHLIVIDGRPDAPVDDERVGALAFDFSACVETVGSTLRSLAAEYGEEGCELRDAFRAWNARSPTQSELEQLVTVQEDMKQRDGVSPTDSAVLAEAARELDGGEDAEEEEGPEQAASKRRLRVIRDSDDDEAEAAEAGSFESIVRQGARIKMCFGTPANWYGGLMGGVTSDGKRIIGFDDGDVKAFTSNKLQDYFDTKTLTALATADGGMIANEPGTAMAAEFVQYKDRTMKTIGLLVGEWCATR